MTEPQPTLIERLRAFAAQASNRIEWPDREMAVAAADQLEQAQKQLQAWEKNSDYTINMGITSVTEELQAELEQAKKQLAERQEILRPQGRMLIAELTQERDQLRAELAECHPNKDYFQLVDQLKQTACELAECREELAAIVRELGHGCGGLANGEIVPVVQMLKTELAGCQRREAVMRRALEYLAAECDEEVHCKAAREALKKGKDDQK